MGFNYFAKACHPNEGWIIKIGFSKDPYWRVSQIRRWSLKPELIATVPGTKGTEAAMHMMLAAYQVSNEWFRPGRMLHRIMLDAIENGELPAVIWNVGEAIDRFTIARRDRNARLPLALKWFGDGDCAGKIWGDSTFQMGKKGPDKFDDSWLPSGLP